jgi:hypothetical protein
LDIEASERAFREIERSTEAIIDKNVTVEELVLLLRRSSLPASFRDILAILVAEGVRKRGSLTAMEEAIELCENPLYRYLMRQWYQRFNHRLSS